MISKVLTLVGWLGDLAELNRELPFQRPLASHFYFKFSRVLADAPLPLAKKKPFH